MKRFHVNVSVADLEQSVEFYTTLFGQDPDLLEGDYAKWMLEDPRVNFAISRSSRSSGINHIGLQADTMDELGEIQKRLEQAGTQTFEQPEAECCYARSSKTWVHDPDAVRWETFVTYGQTTHYGDDELPDAGATALSRCCA